MTERDILRGLKIREEMAALKKEMGLIDGRLKAAALAADHEPLAAEEREGRRVIFDAAGGGVRLPIILTGDKLIASFHDSSPKHHELLKLAGSGENLRRLFKRPTKWETIADDGQKFRKLADSWLAAAAPPFIVACRALDKMGLPKSDIKIMWEDAE